MYGLGGYSVKSPLIITYVYVCLCIYIYTGWSNSLCAPDGYSTNHQVPRDFLITLCNINTQRQNFFCSQWQQRSDHNDTMDLEKTHNRLPKPTQFGVFVNFRKATISFVTSVCLSVCSSAWNNSAHNGRIFIKFDIWVFFFENLPSFIKNRTRITGTLHEDRYIFLIISRSVLLITRNVTYEICRRNQNILRWITFFRKSCLSWDMWKNTVWLDRPQICACALHAGYIRLQTHTQNM
jgi:hypothetical protein